MASAVPFLFILACSDPQEPETLDELRPHSLVQPLFNNGGFETGNLNNWTVTAFHNPGLAVVPPTSVANLGLLAAQSTLASAVTNAQNTLPLSSAATFFGNGGTKYVQVENEVMTYTTVTGNTLTGVARGVGGTTAAAHAAGVLVTAARNSFARSGPTQTLPFAGLGGLTPPVYPLFGTVSTVVNEQPLGNNRNVTSLKQSFTSTFADVDAGDNKLHVRWALSPALQNPGHQPNEQPYFYVELRNLTKGTVLFSDFNFSNQAGIPWNVTTVGGNAIAYTDWQVYDIAPGDTYLAPGDTVEIEIYAAACSLGGHWGEVYVDGFGAQLPGLSVAKAAPQSANLDADITYNFTVKNNTGGLARNVVVDDQLPRNTTFVSVNAPGATCTTPTVGTHGPVSCTYSAMSNGETRTFSLVVHENAFAISGTATAGSATSLSTGQTLTLNQYQGYSVYLTGGTGQGQQRTIGTNTAAGVLNIAGTNFGPVPDTTTTYGVLNAPEVLSTVSAGGAATLTDSSRNGALAWVVNQWTGWTVTIVAGTGAGQVRSILSNTDTQLTVASNWATQPNNTSRYAINLPLGTLTNGNYGIRSQTQPQRLLGPPAKTTLTTGVTYTDLGITVSDGVAAVTNGGTTTYTITVRNNGVDPVANASVTDNFPAGLTVGNWTCSSSSGGTCGTASGSGNTIAGILVSLPPGADVVFTVPATVTAANGTTLSNTATVAAPGGTTDYDTSNNAATDINQVNTLTPLNLTKAGATGDGRVSSAPASIDCGVGCAGQSANFAQGTTVTLTAVARTGDTFVGWSGGGCSGSAPTCDVPIGASAANVVATFRGPTTTGSSGGNGTVSCSPSPATQGATVTCAITPTPGYQLSALTDNGTDVFPSVTGNFANGFQYVFTGINLDHAVVGTFVPDVTPPAPPVLVTQANGSTTNDATPTYSGTAEPGSTVIVRIGGVDQCQGVADGNGNWSCTPTTPLADGNYNAVAVARDAGNNTSGSSNTNNFTIDTAPPVAPVITTPTEGSSTNDTTPTFTGTAEANSTVVVRVDGVVVCTTTASAGGAWSCTPTPPLAEGPHTAVATSSDAAGNATSSAPRAFSVDVTPPPAPVVTAPAEGSRTADSTPTYTGTGEPGTTVTVRVDSIAVCTAVVTAGGTWSCDQVTPLAQGGHAVFATATDAAGNVSPLSNTNNFIYEVNDAPINTVGSPVVVDEDAATALAVSIVDFDAGPDPIEVTLVATHGTLSLMSVAGLTFLAGNGADDQVMRFRGTLAAVNAALATLTYAPDANYNGPAQVTVTTNDLGSFGPGGPQADSDTITITVSPVNDLPSLTDDALAVRNNAGPTSIDVLGNDTAAPDSGETLTITSFTQPAHGTVTQVGNALVYKPAPDYVGPDPFTYTVSDGNGGTATATVRVSAVAPGANQAPVIALATPPAATEDTPVVLPTTLQVSDADAGAAPIELRITLDHGTLTLATTAGLTFVEGDGTNDDFIIVRGTVADLNAALAGSTVTPAANYAGPLHVNVLANDQGNSGTGGAAYDFETLTIDVAPVNDQPSANDDAASVKQDGGAVLISALANDTSAPDSGEVLTIVSASAAANGTVTVVGAQVSYTPAPGFVGTDTFTYTVSDGNGGTATATVTVTVVAAGTNAPPVNRVPAPQTVREDTPLAFNADNLNALTVDDPDAGTGVVRVTLSATNGVLTATGFGSATVTGSGTGSVVLEGAYADVVAALASVVYTPAENYNGPATVTMVTDDLGNTGSGGAQTDTDVIAITVSPVNDPPLAIADVASTLHDVAKTIDVVLNDSATADAGDRLILVSVSAPAHGTAVIVDGRVLYTPAPGYRGPDAFTYVVSDGQGGYATGSVSVTVLDDGDLDPDNDGLTTNEETQLGTNPNDPDSDDDGLLDGTEVATGTNPLDADSDDDGIVDGVEDTNHDGRLDPGETDPRNRDSDGGGVPDGDEDENHNGRVDAGERDPRNPLDDVDALVDSDGDGVPDNVEDGTGTRSDRADTDGDGLPDGVEDVNHNGVVDAGETDPRNPDSDGGGVDDGTEVAQGTNALDASDDNRYRLEGGGLSCAATSAPDGLVVVALLVGFWLMRRRTALVIAAAVLLGPTLGLAQSRGFTINRYEPTPAGEWSFMVDHPWYSSTRLLAAGLTLNYANDPLVYGLASSTNGDIDEFVHVIRHQLIAHADFAVSFRDRVTLSATLPVVLLESGENADGTGPLAGAAVGDPRVGGMVRLYNHPDRDALSLSAGALVWIPLSLGKNVGDEGLRVMPKIVLAGFKHHIWWSATGAFQYRPKAVIGDRAPYPGNNVGSEVSVGAAIYYASLDKRYAIGPEATAASVLTDGNFFKKRYTSIEVLLGGHYNIARLFNVGAAIGTGIAREPGTPDVRILLRLAYAPFRDPEPVREQVAMVEPAHDRDQDGIVDASDTCPDVHKSARPDPDRVGCPELDADGDGVFDRSDACVNVAQGPHPQRGKLGCPDLDTDGDLIFDSYDVCPAEPKGRQPDLTRDGCPLADRDMDQVVDAVDACPDQPGAPDPDPKKNGCPGLVQIKNNQIVIVQPIYFETGKDKILAKSYPVLQAVANALTLQPDIKRVSIEGHTDNRGKPEKNLDLSERRAKAAMRWLIEHGIVAERLEAHGFGQTAPIADNATDDGRQANRRVDFRILDDAAVSP